jgi:ABC-type glycerol-3-phosphate transport system substrate-binding protein
MVRVAVPYQEESPAQNAGALALERALPAIHEAAGGAFTVAPERTPLPRPPAGASAPRQPGELTPFGQALAGLVAADHAPDLVYIQPAGGTPLTPVWDAQSMTMHGLLASLEPALARESRRIRLADFLPPALNALRWQGALYGLPTTARPLMLAYDPALFAASAEPAPDMYPEGITWEGVRASAGRLLRVAPGEGYPTQGGLLVTPPDHVLGQLLLAWGAPWWDAAQAQPHLHTPATVEALRFWKALRQRESGTVPFPGVAYGVRWEPARIMASALRVAMAFTWQPPAGRAALAAQGAPVLRLAEPPRAAVRTSLLWVDGFLAVPAAAPDLGRSVQALGAVLDGLGPALAWTVREATPERLAADPAIASPEEARLVLAVRRSAQATPLHLPSPSRVLWELARAVETGQQPPEEAAQVAQAALAQELERFMAQVEAARAGRGR